MIYNSLREPAYRTARPTARHPDHHHPGDHPVLLCRAGGNYGCSGRRRGGYFSHIYFIIHTYSQPFIDPRVEYTHTEHDIDVHQYPDSNRHADYNSDQFRSSHVDSFCYANSYFNKYFDHNTSDVHFHIHIDSDRYSGSANPNAD